MFLVSSCSLKEEPPSNGDSPPPPYSESPSTTALADLANKNSQVQQPPLATQLPRYDDTTQPSGFFIWPDDPAWVSRLMRALVALPQLFHLWNIQTNFSYSFWNRRVPDFLNVKTINISDVWRTDIFEGLYSLVTDFD